MKILVTGGAGFIGSHLVDKLIEQGNTVRVLDDFSTGNIINLEMAQLSGRLEVLEGTILNPKCLEEALLGIDVVYHLAVQCVRRSLSNPIKNHEINATGTLNTLEAARRAKVSLFIYCSSSEVYGNSSSGPLDEESTVCQPTTVYGASKMAGELYTQAYWRTYQLPTIVVRPFNSYGPREHDQGDLAEVIPRFVIRVLNGLPPVIFGNGSAGRDFTYVTDTARGLASILNTKNIIGSTINLGYGRLVTIKEIAQAVILHCGKSGMIDIEYSTPRPGDVYRLTANTDLAKKLLSFEAKIDINEGILCYLNWFRSRYKNPSLLLEKQVINWQLIS